MGYGEGYSVNIGNHHDLRISHPEWERNGRSEYIGWGPSSFADHYRCLVQAAGESCGWGSGGATFSVPSEDVPLVLALVDAAMPKYLAGIPHTILRRSSRLMLAENQQVLRKFGVDPIAALFGDES